MTSSNVLFYPQHQDMMCVYKKPENIHIYEAGIREFVK